MTRNTNQERVAELSSNSAAFLRKTSTAAEFSKKRTSALPALAVQVDTVIGLGWAEVSNGEPLDMLHTCKYIGCMSKMIQLRHVPDPLHRKLKARAAMEGMSLSDYLLREVEGVAERPTLQELRERLGQRSAIIPRISPAKAVRAERDRR